MMFVLIRRVSSYTHHDLLLGVFRSLAQAAEARAEYIETVLRANEDPWASQAYASVSDNDVEVLDAVPLIAMTSHVDRAFVVSSYAEGFGQVVRKFEAVVGALGQAQAHAKSLEANDDGSCPYSCEIAEVPIGKLSHAQGGYRTDVAHPADA